MCASAGDTDGSIMPTIITAHIPNNSSQSVAPQVRGSTMTAVDIDVMLALLLIRYHHASAVIAATHMRAKARSRRIVCSSAPIMGRRTVSHGRWSVARYRQSGSPGMCSHSFRSFERKSRNRGTARSRSRCTSVSKYAKFGNPSLAAFSTHCCALS